nr:unnamed protein product [Digitaria exilis]
MSATSSTSTPDDEWEWRSTWPQRAWTLAGSAAILSSLFTCARLVVAASGEGLLAAAMAAFAGYSLADLATGIVAFRDHHLRPSAITRLEPCNSLHVLAAAVAVALPVAGAALSSAAAHAFACAFAACAMLSVQFHAWAHERPSRLPRGVAALQAAGVLVSRSQHAGHHRPPHSDNYCTVSGMWNPVMDGCKVFHAMETKL